MRTVSHSKLYVEYLRSEEWQRKKAERLAVDGGVCAMCGRSQAKTRSGLQCHHISYRNLGHEDVYTDLVTLCSPCHQKIHRYYSRVRSADELLGELKGLVYPKEGGKGCKDERLQQR